MIDLYASLDRSTLTGCHCSIYMHASIEMLHQWMFRRLAGAVTGKRDSSGSESESTHRLGLVCEMMYRNGTRERERERERCEMMYRNGTKKVRAGHKHSQAFVRAIQTSPNQCTHTNRCKIYNIQYIIYIYRERERDGHQ